MHCCCWPKAQLRLDVAIDCIDVPFVNATFMFNVEKMSNVMVHHYFVLHHCCRYTYHVQVNDLWIDIILVITIHNKHDKLHSLVVSCHVTVITFCL